jgi:PAS domain S-box-containing protein
LVWLTWWLGDVSGMLVLTPLLLLLPQWRAQDPARGSVFPALALFVAACFLVFGWPDGPGHVDRLFCLVLIASVVYAGYRHGRVGSALAVLGVAMAAVTQTLAGRGPFAKATVNDALISMDGFIALCTLAGLVVAVSSRRVAVTQASDGVKEASVRLPVAILMGGLGLTVLAWHLISADTERRAQERFDNLAVDIRERVVERMDTYELALRGGRGLFDASNEVTRAGWHTYVSSLAIQQRFPGIQGLGFAIHLGREQLPRHEQSMRASGFADYAVHPAGERAEYTSVIYLEPFDERNRRAFAYDMLSEPVRHEAMVRARESGDIAISGRVTLLQEPSSQPQAGFLMYLPVFQKGLPHETPEQRRAALSGYVYAPFRFGNLMAGILQRSEPSTVSIELHDGHEAAGVASLLYRGADAQASTYPHQLVKALPIDLGGQHWTLQASSTPSFEAGVDTQKAQIALVAGTLVSLLMFSVVRALTLHREDAVALAEVMTREHAAAETRFQSLASTAGDGIIVCLLDGTIEFCNGAACRMFGYEREALMGGKVQRLVPPSAHLTFERWLGSRAHANASEAGAQDPISEREALRHDGTLLPIEVSTSAWEVNGVCYIGGVIRDISERKAALALLKKSKADLRSVTDNIPAMVGSWDRHLRNRFCNPEYVDWFGIDPQAARGRHISDVLGDKLYQLNKPLIEQALAGQRVSFERLITSPDGRTRHAQVHYIPDVRDGQVDGFIVLVFDITPLKAAEQALQHNLKLHDIIFNHAGVGIALTRHRVYERVSREFTRLLGYDEGELEGQPGAVTFPDDAAYEAIGRLAREVLPEGKTLDHELLLKRKDGSTIWCYLLARAVDPRDEDQGTIWIIQDFRDRKQREELLERAREEAESAAHLKSGFLANMSHEIRTPMNGIIGMTALTLDSELTEAQRDNLVMVQDSARSLLRLLDDILDFSKIEAGKLALECEAFDLREQLRTTVYPLAVLATGKGVDFMLEVAPEVPQTLWGDTVRLMQVVRNLCSNAVKFTEAGQVSCSVAMAASPSPGMTLAFVVADTGPGIPPSSLDQIFESFVQADSSITRRHGGTGLGLAICEQIVGLMQGRIDVQSTLGQGAEFRFTAHFDRVSAPPAGVSDFNEVWRGPAIQRPASKPAKAAELMAPTSTDSACLDVLLAEDHPVNQKLAQRILEKRGHRVTLAPDGAVAVALARERVFDVILMDVQMPVMDGVTATSEIRRYEANLGRRTPIVALTAHALKGEQEKLLSQGMDAFLAKPFDPRELARLVDTLGRRQPP